MASDIAVGIAVLAAAKKEDRLRREEQAREREEARRQRELVLRSRHVEERSEEHTSELQSLMRISYAVFCLKKKKKSYPLQDINTTHYTTTTANKHQSRHTGNSDH